MKIAQINFDFNKLTIPATPGAPIDINNPNPTLGPIISTLLTYIFSGAGIILLLYLILGGFQYMLSAGDPKAAQAARSHITNALIGFVLIFIAFWVVQLFGLILGLKGITNIFQ